MRRCITVVTIIVSLCVFVDQSWGGTSARHIVRHSKTLSLVRVAWTSYMQIIFRSSERKNFSTSKTQELMQSMDDPCCLCCACSTSVKQDSLPSVELAWLSFLSERMRDGTLTVRTSFGVFYFGWSVHALGKGKCSSAILNFYNRNKNYTGRLL